MADYVSSEEDAPIKQFAHIFHISKCEEDLAGQCQEVYKQF